MSNNILFKSLVNGVITLIVLSVFATLVRGMLFVQAVTLPYHVLMAVTAVAASYIGLKAKEMKTE